VIGEHLWQVYHSGIYPERWGPLSLAIPPWVGAMSILSEMVSAISGKKRRLSSYDLMALYKSVNKYE